MAEAMDRRITPMRPGLAAAHLKGQVAAERFAEADPHLVAVPVAPLLPEPGGAGPVDTQLLFGERVAVYDTGGQWAWVQADADQYVGYVPRACLERDGAAEARPAPTHRVVPPIAHLYAAPDIKHPPETWLSAGSVVAVEAVVETPESQIAFAALATGGHVPMAHLRGIGPATPDGAPDWVPDRVPDWVAEAERFVGLPYLWGGRSGLGVDCSALIQLALQAAGRECPRDSDMQEAALGTTLPDGAAPERGDIVFWTGHVGVMVSAGDLLHANIHHMAVAREPLDAAAERIEAKGGGAITRRARLDGGAGAS